MAADNLETFAGVKQRLDEIVEAVSDDNLSLDDALELYEEAVSLGLRASDLLEADIDLAKEADQVEINNQVDIANTAETAESAKSAESAAEVAATPAHSSSPAPGGSEEIA